MQLIHIPLEILIQIIQKYIEQNAKYKKELSRLGMESYSFDDFRMHSNVLYFYTPPSSLLPTYIHIKVLITKANSKIPPHAQ